MWGIFTYIYHKHEPNVGEYTIHGLMARGQNANPSGHVLWSLKKSSLLAIRWLFVFWGVNVQYPHPPGISPWDLGDLSAPVTLQLGPPFEAWFWVPWRNVNLPEVQDETSSVLMWQVGKLDSVVTTFIVDTLMKSVLQPQVPVLYK